MSKDEKPLRVLLADKQPIVLHALNDLIGKYDKLTVIGKTLLFDEVPGLITRARPDILITDLWFDAHLASPAAAESLRLYKPDLKIILFSTDKSPEIVRLVHRARIEGFVLKTDNLEEIKQAIQNVADGHFYYSPKLINSLLTTPPVDCPSLDQLTPKELQVLRQYAQGLMPKEFAADLNIKPSTAETHIRNIKQTLGFKNTVELLRWAWKQGF